MSQEGDEVWLSVWKIAVPRDVGEDVTGTFGPINRETRNVNNLVRVTLVQLGSGSKPRSLTSITGISMR